MVSYGLKSSSKEFEEYGEKLREIRRNCERARTHSLNWVINWVESNPDKALPFFGMPRQLKLAAAGVPKAVAHAPDGSDRNMELLTELLISIGYYSSRHIEARNEDARVTAKSWCMESHEKLVKYIESGGTDGSYLSFSPQRFQRLKEEERIAELHRNEFRRLMKQENEERLKKSSQLVAQEAELADLAELAAIKKEAELELSGLGVW